MAEEKKQGWRALVSDAWFFPMLFFAIFGGSLPIIALIQQVGFEHDFTAPLRAIIDAYHHGMALFGAWVEPMFQPLFDWFHGLLGIKLHLYPHWRHLLVLALILPVAFLKSALRDADAGWALWLPLLFSIFGAILAGLIDTNGGWWAQGCIAGLPFTMMVLGLAVGAILDGDVDYWESVKIIASIFVAHFILAAGLSFTPGMENCAGLVALGASLVVLGGYYFVDGLGDSDVFNARLGTSMLGGFIGAGLVFGADWLLKTYVYAG